MDNAAASFLGYRPKDNAERFATEILAAEPPQDPQELAHSRHGGPFASTPLGQGVTDSMNIVDDRKET